MRDKNRKFHPSMREIFIHFHPSMRDELGSRNTIHLLKKTRAKGQTFALEHFIDGYFWRLARMAAWADASRASGTRNGLQLT